MFEVKCLNRDANGLCSPALLYVDRIAGESLCLANPTVLVQTGEASEVKGWGERDGDSLCFADAEVVAESKASAQSIVACVIITRQELARIGWPGSPVQRGTPISQLSGRPGHPGYERFTAIAASWGHD